MKRALLITSILLLITSISCNQNSSNENNINPNSNLNSEMTTNNTTDNFDVRIISDETTNDGVRHVSVATCSTVCSTQIDIELNGDIIVKIEYTGGCNGNLKGIASLVSGMEKSQAIERLEGIDCSGRGTSCPDQLARALKLL